MAIGATWCIFGEPAPAGREAKITGPKLKPRASLIWRPSYLAWKRRAVPLLERWLWQFTRAEQRLMGLPWSRQAMAIEAQVVFNRPKRKPLYTVDGERCPYPLEWTRGRNPHLGTTDWDNLAKGPGDALVDAKILQDDRWIVRGTVEKWYAADNGERPHVLIRLLPFEAFQPKQRSIL